MDDERYERRRRAEFEQQVLVKLSLLQLGQFAIYKEMRIMATNVHDELSEVIAEAHATQDVEASALVVLGSLSARLDAALLAVQTNPADTAALVQLSADLANSRTALAAAIAAVPAEPAAAADPNAQNAPAAQARRSRASAA